jgi:hypothetical protein
VRGPRDRGMSRGVAWSNWGSKVGWAELVSGLETQGDQAVADLPTGLNQDAVSSLGNPVQHRNFRSVRIR